MDFPRRALIASLALASRAALASGDFWEAPVHTLPEFLTLDQLPAKSFEEIFRETKPATRGPYHEDFQAEILALAVAVEKAAPATLLPAVEQLLASARAQQPRLGPGVTNLLHDVRDLFAAGTAKPAEAAEYLRWRVDHAAYFNISFQSRSASDAPMPAEAADAQTTEIARQLAAASPALRPHWLYLRGACAFKHGQDTAAQPSFQAVLDEAPQHPRAETALFMVARCQLSRSRTAEYLQAEPHLHEAERPRVKQLFEQYLQKYPQGRFVGDALGWLGAFAFDGGDFAGALGYYLRQLEVPDHPEFIQPAAIMCEKLLARLAAEPDDETLRELTRQPRVAQALVYLLVNASESDHFNEEFDAVADVQTWRKALLPRVAAALAAQEKLPPDAPWRPRHLATLALAASGAGQQGQALQLIDSAGAALDKSDDLLFARGVVLQRAQRAREASDVFRTLQTKFPQSPLGPGTQLRLALALLDDHQAGEAVLVLRPLAVPPAEEWVERMETESRPVLEPVPDAQMRQLIDALLNFAPPAELAAAAQKPGLDPLARLQLTEALAARYLAREQFDQAKKYVTPAQWGLAGAALENLTAAAKAAPHPAAKAAACRKLADAWAAARGQLLTFPLDTDQRRQEVFGGDAPRASQRRLASAAALGVRGNIALDLENRDELRHAFNWWLAASDAQPGTPASATALWRALRAMPQIADVSPFTYERAVSRNWSEVSRQLHDRLRRECPASVEAKRLAVYWNFSAKATDDAEEWRELAGQDLPGHEAFLVGSSDESSNDDAMAGLTGRIAALETRGGEPDVDALRQEVAGLRAEAGSTFRSLTASFWINHLEDLGQFLREPDPGPEVRQTYFELRGACLRVSAFGFWKALERTAAAAPTDGSTPDPETLLRRRIANAQADPRMKPIADYLAFLDAAVVANRWISVPFAGVDKDGEPYTYRSRDYPLLEKLLRDFLEKYPQSRKREAALLLHVRALYHCSKPVVFKKEVTWPQAPRWEGGYEASFTAPQPFEATKILAAIDAAERKFPGGRYAAELRGYRAAVELRRQRWKPALTLIVAQFDDEKAPHLQEEAANRLGTLFAALADDSARADVLAAIKPQARARELLQQYLAYESDLHPLKYLKTYLRDQLAAK